MKQVTQLDNVIAFNNKREREKALAALAKAKEIERPVKFLPQGFSNEIEKLKKEKENKKF